MSSNRNHPQADGSRPWVSPRLERLGRITDIVQGQGKVDTQDDQDPNNTAKSGQG